MPNEIKKVLSVNVFISMTIRLVESVHIKIDLLQLKLGDGHGETKPKLSWMTEN